MAKYSKETNILHQTLKQKGQKSHLILKKYLGLIKINNMTISFIPSFFKPFVMISFKIQMESQKDKEKEKEKEKRMQPLVCLLFEAFYVGRRFRVTPM
jgi:endo-1,4-beta-D-glucanase Y